MESTAFAIQVKECIERVDVGGKTKLEEVGVDASTFMEGGEERTGLEGDGEGEFVFGGHVRVDAKGMVRCTI